MSVNVIRRETHIVFIVVLSWLLTAAGASAATFFYSVDIGSDLEWSDPNFDGDENMDPAWIYTPAGGAYENVKNDLLIFSVDPPPSAGNPVPVGPNDIQTPQLYFDIDGEDQLDIVPGADYPLQGPVQIGPRPAGGLFYNPDRLYYSLDDDGPPAWWSVPPSDVPVVVLPDRGTASGMDEILDAIGWRAWPVPGNPVADESSLGLSTNPPDSKEDDDVDALDTMLLRYWYWTCDHEAHYGLDPGAIYLTDTMAAGPNYTLYIPRALLGVSAGTDIDAFEFCVTDDIDILQHFGLAAGTYLAVLFSVDQDDPTTPNTDESGALGAGVIYISLLNGTAPMALAAIDDDVDAIALEEYEAPPDPTKWIQRPDLTETGMDVKGTHPNLLADDFNCTTNQAITRIVIWSSWRMDEIPNQDPQSVVFALSFHSDIPVPPTGGYSQPADPPLWVYYFAPGSYTAEIEADGIVEWWYDPLLGEQFFPGDTVCWKYTFDVPIEEAFVQTGTVDNAVVYWLDAQVISELPQGYAWGWKTSLDHWNDDAVWTVGDEMNHDPWIELRYPPGHPLNPQSIDLAFALYGTDPPEEEERDWGDAPDFPGALAYPTLASSGGANHLIGGPWLGDATDVPDAEADGQPDPNALGDDNDGNDDEDGVAFPVFVIGQSASIQYEVNGTAGIAVPVEFWIDWDANSTWDATEYYSANVTDGIHTLSILAVPATAVPGQTFARVRISTSGTGVPTGPAPDGEVEDYEVYVEQETVQEKWIQSPDLSPTGLDVSAMYNIPCLLADDFLCEEKSTITNIVVWGSWLDDMLPMDDPNNVSFTLSIHADIPAGTHPRYPWSMPGQTLWVQTFNPGSFTVQPEATGLIEGWYDPVLGIYIPIADRICWRYQFPIDPLRAFIQTGTVDNAVVYWLDVQATPHDGGQGAMFGWKTSLDHWNDDACFVAAAEPYNGDWFELIYPIGHQMEMQSIDLAFALGGGPVPDPQPDPVDYGDAPDSSAAPLYPTLAANGGAAHVIGGPWLGGANDAPDGEFDGIPTVNADGDDLVTSDDENGVMMPTFFVGMPTTVPVTISGVTAGGGAVLEIWFDWNGNGSWTDGGEFIGPIAIPADNTYGIPVTAPLGSVPGQSYARFRVSTLGIGVETGLAPDGEVEDYTITIKEQFDYGDAPDPTYPTYKASGGAAHVMIGPMLGSARDMDLDGQPDPAALGDDNDGGDDEDGVLFPAYIRCDRTETITVTASASCRMNAWLDFNGDGTWADPGEKIFANVALAAGTTNLTFHVPFGSNIGTNFARFRVSTAGGDGVGGLSANGEVEDYAIETRAKFPQALGLKWRQPPDCKYGLNLESWTLVDQGAGINTLLVADDWWCDGRPINSIRWWGSYILYDGAIDRLTVARPSGFRLKWYLDIPAGYVSNYSRPGPLLKQADVTLAAYGTRLENLDEATEKYVCTVPLDFLGDSFLGAKEHKFEYNVVLSKPWMEKNTLSREHYDPPCSSNIYWISIEALYSSVPTENPWGWETTPKRFNWNDAAVVTNTAGGPPPWIPLTYIPAMWPWAAATAHPYIDEPVNMAFAMLSEVVGRRDVKWQQLPNMILGTDMPSWRYMDPFNPPVPRVRQELRADDFVSEGRRLTDIHWWGSYIGWQSRYTGDEFDPVVQPLDPATEAPLGFDLSWHAHDPSSGGPGILLTNVFIPIDRCHEMYYCTIEQLGHETYLYEHEYQYYVDLLDEKLSTLPWLEQEGVHYWLNIQAVFANSFIPGNPVQNPDVPHEGWGWKIAGIAPVEPGIRLEPSKVITNILSSGTWIDSRLPPWHVFTGAKHDLSFELTTDQPDTNKVINIVSIDVDLTETNVYVGSVGTGGAGIQVLQKTGSLKPAPITWVDVEVNPVPFPVPWTNTWLRASATASNEFYRVIEFTP